MAATDYYQTPSGNDTTGVYEFFRYVSQTATEGLFFPVIIFVIWIVGFLALKQYSTSRAMVTSSIFCAILSIILAVMNLVSPKFMYIFIIASAVGLLWVKLEGD
jgi:hypothetical protein